MDLHDIREDYSKQELSKADCADTPLPQFEKWLNEAIHSAAKEPTAMSVATVDEAGRPNSRILLLKEVNDRGFVFFSNYQSRKGRALAAHPFAALTFFWPELERQVRAEGRVEKLDAKSSDEYFASRPYTSRVGQRAEQRDCRQKHHRGTRSGRSGETPPARTAPATLGRLSADSRPGGILARPPQPPARPYPIPPGGR